MYHTLRDGYKKNVGQFDYGNNTIYRKLKNNVRTVTLKEFYRITTILRILHNSIMIIF